jgi:hypothetical protein
MSDIFTITRLAYDESTDTLTADAYQSNHFGEESTEAEAQIKIRVTHRFADASAIELTYSEYNEHDAIFLPTVLLAFCTQFQKAHYAQSEGDSPALTKLDTFTVEY